MSSRNKLNIFITGPTGYIGGSVLVRLLQHPDSKCFQISALVHSSTKVEKLKTLGIRPVLGSYSDLDLLTREAAEADFVITMTDSDALPPAAAILTGMKQRHVKTGTIPKLIHTSGVAFVMDNAMGMHGDHPVYSDLDIDAIEAVPDTQFHRNVDIPIIAADKEGYLMSYIVAPANVFGTPSGALVDMGIQNEHSFQLPIFYKIAIARKQGGYIGAGKNILPAVDVNDTADLFLLLFNAIRSNPENIAHGREGIYFAANCEYTGYEIAKAISEALVDLGIGSSPEATSFTKAELKLYFRNLWPLLAPTCRPRADRSRALGWKPHHGKDALLASVKPEVEYFFSKVGVNKCMNSCPIAYNSRL